MGENMIDAAPRIVKFNLDDPPSSVGQRGPSQGAPPRAEMRW